MAYAAVVNLTNTIRGIKKNSRLTDLPYSFDTLDYPYDEIKVLEKVIRKLDGRGRTARLKAFYENIREAANGLEDVLDSVLSNLIRIAQSHQSIGNERPEEEVRQGLNSFVEKVNKIKEEYSNELGYPPLPEDDNDSYCTSDSDSDADADADADADDDDDDYDEEEKSEIGFGGKKPKMVGSNSLELITKIKDQLNTGYKSSELRVVSIVGKEGSGRSSFAWSLFHAWAPYWHKLRALVCIGPKYEFKDILLNILSQIDDTKLPDSEQEEKIFECLHTILKGGDYLIVLDDVRETRVWEYLRKLFPDENNGSRVLLTTRLKKVAVFAQSFSIHRTYVLHSEESWDVICRVLFRNKERCPPELEKIGKEIAKNCEGLLFEVARYAALLSEVGQTPEEWNNVEAEMTSYAVNNDAYSEMSEISRIGGDDYSIFHPRCLPRIMKNALGLRTAIHCIWRNIYIFPTYVAVVGMAGIGKTAIAREVFDDPWTLHSYDHRVWLTLGPKYEFKRILVDILAQLDPNIDKMHNEDGKTLVKHISSILSAGKRCLMVLDDVWEKDPWSYLSKLLEVIQCEVLLTTRLSGVAREYFGKSDEDRVHEMQLLDEEESWSLLREGVFGEELLPRELEKPGKLIAMKCEGLPLMIVTVASLLSGADEMTPEYWTEVATNKNLVFELAYLKISKILYPSYKNLDLEYRALFLYMAAFRVKQEITLFKLSKLYTFEGIIPSGSWTSENFLDYMDDLRGKSLVRTQFVNNLYTCRIHSVFWHLCAREARNDKFFHVMKTRADCLLEDIEKQRRLCVQNNVLFAIKDAHDSMASVSAARSLLCFGPPHPYQVPLCLESKLMKVLDALSIRLYEFPVGILKLVLLRYLALRYNGELPATISKLWNLELLIIHRHMSINFPGYLSYLPVEIWEMKELKHLQIMGSNLPDPPPNSSSAILDRLSTLIDVRAESVTKNILERIPNLEILCVRIELAPDHASDPSFSFDHISHLKRLEKLSCVIVNPELKSMPAPFSMFSSSLKQLALSGSGYPWEYMRPVALLPNLEDLELKCYAFRGAEWVMQEGDFNRLCYLTLDDTDLVNWRADDSCHLLSLRELTIRHCFKLKDIPWQSIPRSCLSELVDCNPSVWAKTPRDNCQIFCSWLDGHKL